MHALVPLLLGPKERDCEDGSFVLAMGSTVQYPSVGTHLRFNTMITHPLSAPSAKVSLVSRPKRHGLGRHYGAMFGSRVVLDLQKEGIRAIPADEFAEGRRVLVEREVDGESARRALDRARTAGRHFPNYRFVDGNCEHFARYVVEGSRKSDQISMLLIAGVFVAFLCGLSR